MRVSGTWQGPAGLETVMGSACQAFPGSVAREPRWWLNALTVVGQSWIQSCFVVTGDVIWGSFLEPQCPPLWKRVA